MEYEAIFIYCLAECVVNFAHIQDDPQSQMTHAEIITFVMISTLYYQCNMWLGSISKSNFYSKSLRKFCKLFLINGINLKLKHYTLDNPKKGYRGKITRY